MTGTHPARSVRHKTGAWLRRVLEDSKAEVMTASCAAEALHMIAVRRPDLLVSDIGMPEVDGFSFLRQVRELDPERGGNMAAVALTAFARPEDRVRALRAGFAAHVAKPIEATDLVMTVAVALRSARRRPW